jgi:hypothetical protein
MVEDTRSLHPHASVYKKSKTVCTSRSRNVNSTKWGQPKAWEKSSPWNIEAIIWEWEKMRREKAYFWPWRYGTSRCTESKLSLADAASLLLFLGEMGFAQIVIIISE